MIDNSKEFLVATISKQDIIDSFKNSPYGCVPDIVKKKLDVVTSEEMVKLARTMRDHYFDSFFWGDLQSSFGHLFLYDDKVSTLYVDSIDNYISESLNKGN